MKGEGIPRIEIFPDKMCFTFHLQNCRGVPDEDKIFEVRRQDLGNLRTAPDLSPGFWTFEMRYLRFNAWGQPLVFTYHNYQESCSGPWSEEDISGPYRERGE